jgi:hypothetical protein
MSSAKRPAVVKNKCLPRSPIARNVLRPPVLINDPAIKENDATGKAVIVED